MYSVIAQEEGELGLGANAYFGYDTIGLGLTGSGLPKLKRQLVGGIASNNYWLGSLGLSPVPYNFTDLNDPVPSLLTNLKAGGHVPSLSWGYTAGAAYHDPPIYGSLILGGYDPTRFDSSKSLSNIPFGADFSRDLLVQLESITYDTAGSSPLLAQSIYVFIDSMVTQMWLPIPTCDAFAKAFDLTWDAASQFYLVNDTSHSALVAQNPTFTFTIASGDKSVDIVLPYAAFDLEIFQAALDSDVNGFNPNSSGNSDTTSKYFPIRRAQNDSQYTLGRVFLQEAYVTADYERHNFSISQAAFPSTSVAEQLTPIYTVGYEPPAEGGSGLSGGAIVGIVVGAIVVLVLIVGVVLLMVRRRKKQARETAHPSPEYQTHRSELAKMKPELDDVGQRRHEAMDTGRTPELEGDRERAEKQRVSGRSEMAGSGPLDMRARQAPAAELEAPWR